MRDVHVTQATEIFLGYGKLNRVGEIAAQYGKKALVVTSDEPWVDGVMRRIEPLLREKGVAFDRFAGVVPNPTTDSIDLGTEAGRRAGADLVIALGGGSAIDSAKAIAVAVGHGGAAWEYRFRAKPITEKTLPIVAISTTSGTGSEVTPFAVVTKTDIRSKYALVSRLLCPRAAIVDPDLTLSVPPRVTASTGFDAYCHAFESTVHKDANDYNDVQAFWAMKTVVDNLPRALADGGDREARGKLALASTVAGLCIANVGCTLSHGIGVAISGHAPHVYHGESLAITYPAVARLSWRAAPRQYAEAARQIIPELAGAGEAEAAARAEEATSLFLKRIGMRFDLASKKVAESDLDGIVRESFALPDYEMHPVVLDEAGMKKLIRDCWRVA